MEEKNSNKRASMFTVRNAENAMITFTILALFFLLGVLLHEMLLKGQSFFQAFYTIARNISQIMSAATMSTIFEEGIDIMFQRIRDTLKREKKLKAQWRAEGKAEVYREVAEWNNRRTEAEARGEKFMEPPPAPPQDPSA